MVRAILKGGVIQPMSPLPEDWSDGQELMIEEVSPVPEPKELAAWSAEIDALSSEVPSDDFERIEIALKDADRESKEVVRRQMRIA